MVTIDDFFKLELKVGTVVEANAVDGSDKMIKLMVDIGEDESRQILSGIRQWYQPDDLIGKQFIFITNLEPRMIMGLESNGMLLAAGAEKPMLLSPIEPVVAGEKIH